MCTNLVRELVSGPDWESLLLTETEHEKTKQLVKSAQRPMSLRVAMSLVLPEHRRIGLYKELLRYFIMFTEAHGFQVIKSRHKATNNAVIIPKLKLGFFITGMELSDTMGTLVHLSYLHNQNRRDLLHARSGFAKATEKVRPLLS